MADDRPVRLPARHDHPSVLASFGLSSSLQDSSSVALYWSWYNIVVLIVAIGVCIEWPRFRRNEWLTGAETVVLEVDRLLHVYVTSDVSVGGMGLSSNFSDPVGTRVSIRFRGTQLESTVVRRSASSFALALDDTEEMHTVMVCYVYFDGFRSLIGDIRPARVARKM